MDRFQKNMNSVLIIEDNEVNRLLLEDILKEKYHVISAENGKLALDILQQSNEDIAVILLDIQMPLMNGYEFLEIVRKDAVYSRIPVIVTTVLDDISDEIKCLELGAVDFIVKPYNPAIAKLRIENIIRLREQEDIISELEMDSLTGFKTRKAYYNDIEMIENSSEGQRSVGVVFTDINGLKQINDSMGHKAGDKLIVSIAKEISDIFPDASKYRLGGDEFVILSFDESQEDFESKISELINSWDEEHSAAVGHVWLKDARDLEKNVAKADKQMYQDKSSYYADHERRRYRRIENEENLIKLEEAAEFLPIGFFIYHADEDEELITYNHQLCKLYGCENDKEFQELTKNTFKGMVHPEDLKIVKQDIDRQIKQEKDIDIVSYRIICRDGKEKQILDYGRFVHTDIYGDVYFVLLLEVPDDIQGLTK